LLDLRWRVLLSAMAARRPTSTARTPSAAAQADCLLTADEAAARVRVARSTVLSALRAGALRGAKVGGRGHWRIREEDLWAWALWPGADAPGFGAPSQLALSERVAARRVLDGDGPVELT
jgi:excisionase family DNA binding protein